MYQILILIPAVHVRGGDQRVGIVELRHLKLNINACIASVESENITHTQLIIINKFISVHISFQINYLNLTLSHSGGLS